MLTSWLYSFQCDAKVAVMGASGGIGQPLSLLLKQSPLVTELSLFDIVNTPGVAADLSHINTPAKVKAFNGPEQLKDSLRGAQVCRYSAEDCVINTWQIRRLSYKYLVIIFKCYLYDFFNFNLSDRNWSTSFSIFVFYWIISCTFFLGRYHTCWCPAQTRHDPRRPLQHERFYCPGSRRRDGRSRAESLGSDHLESCQQHSTNRERGTAKSVRLRSQPRVWSDHSGYCQSKHIYRRSKGIF